MKCKILHDTAGRLRVHLCCKRMTLRQADVLEYYLLAVDGVRSVKVYDRTRDAVVVYDAERERMIRALARFSFEKAEKLDLAPEHTSRTLNREFEDKLALTVMRRCASNLFLPAPVTSALAVIRSAKYIKEGLLALWHRKLSVAVLDATAVTVSMVRGDFATAGSVMFMLRLGEILEEWTHKKSVADLASAMSLRVENVWQQVDGTEVLTKVTDVKPGGSHRDPHRRHDPAGWPGDRGRGHGEPVLSHRRIHAGGQAARQPCLCRYGGRGRRVCGLRGKGIRQRTL